MLREISLRQLQEWFAFIGLEGLPEKRADIRNGMLCALIANVNRDSKRKQTPFKATDFMLRLKEEEDKSPTEDDIRRALDKMAASGPPQKPRS